MADAEPVESPAEIPLFARLSQAVVAFTIEFDNEFEHRMPHRTTNLGVSAGGRGPWLVSLVMWSNCMRFVGEDGVTVGELERLARTKTNLNGMQRWGYVSVAPTADERRAKPPPSSAVIHATARGRRAQGIWRPLSADIESRWEKRFGVGSVRELRGALGAVVGAFDVALPECLPILGYGLTTRGSRTYEPPSGRR